MGEGKNKDDGCDLGRRTYRFRGGRMKGQAEVKRGEEREEEVMGEGEKRLLQWRDNACTD